MTRAEFEARLLELRSLSGFSALLFRDQIVAVADLLWPVVEESEAAVAFYWPQDEHGEVTTPPDREEPYWGARADRLRATLAALAPNQGGEK